MSKGRRFIRALVTALCVAALMATVAPMAWASAPASGPRGEHGISTTTVSDALQLTNVVPTWGAQIPKVVYDGRWYYAASLDGSGSEYPWQSRIFKSRDAKHWVEAVHLPGHVYQPIALLVDGRGRLHVQVGCYTGAECYPGVAPKPGADQASVYTVHLAFGERLPDGSVDFGRFADHTLRTGITERYYQGAAMDPSGRYMYSAYAVDGWDLYLNVFDTVSGSDVHTTRIGTPPAGRAWLYPRVQPGKRVGEVYLSFSQYVLGGPNSAYLDGATLWRTTDGGRTFADQRYLTQMPAPDGNLNWVDASDVTVGPDGAVHAVFFRQQDGVATLYYQRGLNGTPVPVGPLDNHSQIVVRPDGERIIFTTQGADLVVARSRDGVQWSIEHHTVDGVSAALWPNLLQARSGSRLDSSVNEISMLVSGQRAGSSAFSPLIFLTYR